jgi:hypothetical protein
LDRPGAHSRAGSETIQSYSTRRMPPDPPGATSLVAGLSTRSPSLPLPGETIAGKYLVERVLGAGGPNTETEAADSD